MGEHIKLSASDGTVIGAYVAKPIGPAKNGMVVIQEIFGINNHIRSVVDDCATNKEAAETATTRTLRSFGRNL